jgi:hypothetical protein
LESRPYAAPRAPVADVTAAGGSPRLVAMTAIALVGFATLLELLALASTYQSVTDLELPLSVGLAMALELVIVASIAWLLWKRKGWARWLLLAFTIWRSFALTWSVMTYVRMTATSLVDLGPWLLVQWLVMPLCLAVAVVLVFWPARTWFQKKHEQSL